jgi:hypothetical protein
MEGCGSIQKITTVPDPRGPKVLKYRSGSGTLMDFTVDLPDMLSRDVGLRLCLAMVEL